MLNILVQFKGDIYGNITNSQRAYAICESLDKDLADFGYSAKQNNFNHALFFKDVLTVIQRYFDEAFEPSCECIEDALSSVLATLEENGAICWSVIEKYDMQWLLSSEIVDNEQLYLKAIV